MTRDGWNQTTLGEVAQLVTAKSKPDAESPYIALEHINGDGANSINGCGKGSDYKSSSVKFETGDILFSKLRPYLNKVWQAEFDGFATGEALVYRANLERVTQDFLYLVLRSQDAIKYASDRSIGTRMPRIAPAIMADFPITVPPLDEQPEIVRFMQALDAVIQSSERASSLLVRVREDILEVLLRQAQEKNNSVRLGKVATAYQPKTISKANMIPDGKYPVFGANGIIGRYNDYNHEESQIAITCRGATCGTVNVTEPYSWITGNAMVVRSTDSALSNEFLKLFFERLDMRSIITGSAQPQITKGNIQSVEIPLPPLEEQEKIVEKMQALDTYLESAKRSQEALKQVRKDALHALLSGDKDVRELAEMFAVDKDVA